MAQTHTVHQSKELHSPLKGIMAKIYPANIAPDALPRARGIFIVRITPAGIIAQKWPRKRGKPTNPKVAFTSKQFSIASRMAANSEPLQMETARYLTKGTIWMPRDLLVMAAYGKAYELVNKDGTIWTQAFHGLPIPIPPAEWQTTAEVALDTNDAGWNGYTLRQRIEAAQLSNLQGSGSRITFRSSVSAGGMTIAKAYIGQAATTGDTYDFAATPIQLLFAGMANVTVAQNAEVQSDEAEFYPATGQPLLLSMYFNAASATYSKNTQTGWLSYYKAGDSAAAVNTSGYTPWRAATAVKLVQTKHP